MDQSDFRDLKNPQGNATLGAAEVQVGLPIPPVRRVQNFSADEWEEFVEEWAHSLKSTYKKVRRYGGAGDQGCDVVGFKDDKGLYGAWDNYQCKHYQGPLAPGDIWVEIGKVIYYSYIGEYSKPERYYFVAPKGVGTRLAKLMEKPAAFKQGLLEKWDTHCRENITDKHSIELDYSLKAYISSFDFTIFNSKSVVEIIEGHSKTPFYSTRFGGGLPPRPKPLLPPDDVDLCESRYVEQLLEAYSDHTKSNIAKIQDVLGMPGICDHFKRSRLRFYHAESLRNFARDNVPPGTFEGLQEEIYHGVVEICEGNFQDGLERLNATTSAAATVDVSSNALHSRTQTQDKQGVCHQLANENKLLWVKK